MDYQALANLLFPNVTDTPEALEEKYPLAVADLTQIHSDLLATGKQYRDMTGNNINHPNDYLIRVYAQVLLKTLIGKDE